jgi:hypothetical protein
MKFLTKELESKLPALYAQENVKDPICYVKFFDPCSQWTWYVMEYSPEERLYFGYVVGFEKELGYFSRDELEKTKNRMGLHMERDLHFEPTPLSKVKEKHP